MALAVFRGHERVDLREILGEAKFDDFFLRPSRAGRQRERRGACECGRQSPHRFLHYLSMPRVAEGPNEKVIAHVVVDLGKAERLIKQKADNQRAIKHKWNMRDDIRIEGQIECRRHRTYEIVEKDRRQQHKARAEKAAEHAAKAAYDHHRDRLDRNFEVELLGRDSAVIAEGQHGTRHTADE